MFPACVQRTGRSVPSCIQAAARAADGATTPRLLAPNAQKRRPGATGRWRRRPVRPGGVRWPTAQRGARRGLLRTGPDSATNPVDIRGCSRGPRQTTSPGRNHRRPSVGFVSTTVGFSPEDPCRREGLLSVLSVTFKNISNVFEMHARCRAALEDGRHLPHIASAYRSLRRGQTQFGFTEEVYAGVLVRK